MILLDKPYVSDFLKETIKENSIPVIDTASSRESSLFEGTVMINQESVIHAAENGTKIYTNSENAIGWIAENMSFTDIPSKIELFKNKFRFRELTSSMYPEFFYMKVNIEDIGMLDISSLPFPFITKPSVGFFSMGVYKVSEPDEWPETKQMIMNEIDDFLKLYPDEVLDYSSMIIEECIHGDEYAIDAYFDSNGEPVILNI